MNQDSSLDRYSVHFKFAEEKNYKFALDKFKATFLTQVIVSSLSSTLKMNLMLSRKGKLTNSKKVSSGTLE